MKEEKLDGKQILLHGSFGFKLGGSFVLNYVLLKVLQNNEHKNFLMTKMPKSKGIRFPSSTEGNLWVLLHMKYSKF